MRIDSLIIDNFLDDPDFVRNIALNAEFEITGNFPGSRTFQCDEKYNQEIISKLEKILNAKIVEWNKHKEEMSENIIDVDTSCFQLCLENDKTWIHRDPNEWTGILYLTPGAPIDSGTGIYMHKKTRIFKHSQDRQIDDVDINNWQLIAFAGNLYNRMFLFRGELYHRSVIPGFGTNKYTGRLTQTFFFNTTEYQRIKQ